MKYNYLLVSLLLGTLSQSAAGQATAWRPFRPGRVYEFQPAGSTSPLVHTLRADSAYATAAGDSVYTFNRLLRRTTATNSPFYKSRNNFFGARLRWQPGTSAYYLETNAEPWLGGAANATSLLLKPRAAVGSSWSASTVPALSATLTRRVAGSVNGTVDSVATITLSNGQALTLSRQYGLVAGPPWLTLATGTVTASDNWHLHSLPQPGLDDYTPQQLWLLNAGDELGFQLDDLALFSPSCFTGYRLQRLLSRQQTADSLVITYQEQDRITTAGWPGCGTAGTSLSPIRRGRWAFSLRTGASPQFPFLGLLSGEYRPATAGATRLYVGQGIAVNNYSSPTCLLNTRALSFVAMYNTAPAASGAPPAYNTGLDAAYIIYTAGAGLGINSFQDGYKGTLTYYRRGTFTCGAATAFSTLLPSRAEQAAAAATLYPNPAAEAAALTLAAPALPGTVLVLADALGRRVWSSEVAPGQTSLSVPVASHPAGLYLVQLLVPGGVPLTWKLQH